MTSITRDLRKELENTVKQARRAAEAGARKAVQQLRVGDGDAPKDLTADQRVLRTQLRAHGRQLGDHRDAKTGAQETAHLVQECAYEHWHRMLFARFLAEADLLIEPESGVAITLDEVQELAREKAMDWLELASEYAERMLPQIFRKEDPVLQIGLPPETRSEMEDLLKGLSKRVFDADDSLGWVYQFWQTDKKDEINKSENKIGADELPAVTQLFTEDYMVLFLLHNTLGAWWAGKVLAASPSLAASAPDEMALHAACKVGDIDWSYLRFTRKEAEGDVHGNWQPAAGTFDGWPKSSKKLTVLDPCMGSGHFLVFALAILVAIRSSEEGLSYSAAVEAVLRDNLFGLEIDPRCTQIAAFNLAFTAWRMVGYRHLPQLNLACSGLDIAVTKPEWLKLAEKAVAAADPGATRDLLGVETNLLTVGLEARVKNGLEGLYDLFAKAPWLGSLINPRRAGADIFRESFERLSPLLASILAAADTADVREMAVAAQGMAKAAELLGRTFTLVVTNVPYLGHAKMDLTLADHVDRNFSEAKADLATVFVGRLLQFCSEEGTTASVTPQNWWFLGSYKALRKSILKSADCLLLTDLGSAAFEIMNWWVAQTTLQIVSPNRSSDRVACINASDGKWPPAKSTNCRISPVSVLSPMDLLSQPDHRFAFEVAESSQLLSAHAASLAGILNGDTPRFIRKFWEIPRESELWAFQQTTVEETCSVGGLEQIIYYDSENGHLREDADIRRDKLHDSDQRGNAAWGKRGVAISQMRTLPVSRYFGDKFDSNVAIVCPKDEAEVPALWCFLSSEEFIKSIRNIEKKVNVTNATFGKVPFEVEYWRKVAHDKFPNGLPSPSSSDPTQWIFSGAVESANLPLHVAVSRLLGYSWPRQTGSSFIDSPALGQDHLEVHCDTDGIVCLTRSKGNRRQSNA